MKRGALFFVPLIFSFYSYANVTDVDISGKIEVQNRYYFSEGKFPNQDYKNLTSFAIQPEFYWEWNNAKDSLIFKPFYRHDQRDDERTHADIRELLWTHIENDWELKAGIGKVFWGVTEFQHLVDTINQTDSVESFDGEEKLGQTMVNFSSANDWGIIDLYVLPKFEERKYAGIDGRLRAPIVIDNDRALYESSKRDNHVDYAVRWSHSIDVFDIGVHWFKGTNREPIISDNFKTSDNEYIAFYEQIEQFGVDAQATVDQWLWKFEAMSRDGIEETFLAAQAGFEYSFFGVGDSDLDVGLLLEYGWDERGEQATSASQNDVFFGTRLTFNNVESTEVLFGSGYDLDFDSYSLFIEASHRINNHWKFVIDARMFEASKARDPSYVIHRDDYIQVSFEYYL
ncbi:MAG: hypothetical protein ACPGSN_08410 [Psychrobium sp.]